MLSGLKYEGDLDGLVNQLGNATALTPDLIRHVIADTCTRLPALKTAGKAPNIDRLIEDGALCDAALAILEFELPTWKLRRLIYEDGEWYCSLSEQPYVPVELDDTADARHQVLPLAILGTFLEARRRMRAKRETRSPTVPQVRPTSGLPICCDNFA
jgi:hypothetical protein